MPNQLSKFKRRKSLAEHEAVLAVLEEIARHENTTAMALLRQAVRELIRKRASDPSLAALLRSRVSRLAPRVPDAIASAAQLARFKRMQREHDRVLLDLALAEPLEIQERNSIVPPGRAVRLIDFDKAHAVTTTQRRAS